ncbi:14053_t:CDS:2 [Acaulospora morrowiae]|uniref:Protein BCP1 n=1 Tax=Acaulospora morrowiae TaxID=94023 RepID=A0A9N9AGH6_9GLOM|nr:14053_t:CDS:2 [Acaulospora morrowiae]
MGKRKTRSNNKNVSDKVVDDPNRMDVSDEGDPSDALENDNDDVEEGIIDVDFDFFDPKKIDFHSIKNLLIQLFSSDSELFHLSELTELIIDQPLLGSTVKVDGSESDPYALLTVLNINKHKEKQCMKSLVGYLLEKTKKDSRLHDKLTNLFRENSEQHVGLILSERLINMPVQIVPPMYKMLQEEIQWAIEDAKVMSTVDDADVQKSRKKKARSEQTTFYFHAEDEIIEQNSDYQLNFEFTKQSTAVSDSRRAFSDFGIAPEMKLFLLHKSKFDKLIQDLENACK